jgi:hypothetical protein
MAKLYQLRPGSHSWLGFFRKEGRGRNYASLTAIEGVAERVHQPAWRIITEYADIQARKINERTG